MYFHGGRRCGRRCSGMADIFNPALPPGFAGGNGRLEANEIYVATKYPGRIQDVYSMKATGRCRPGRRAHGHVASMPSCVKPGGNHRDPGSPEHGDRTGWLSNKPTTITLRSKTSARVSGERQAPSASRKRKSIRPHGGDPR
jgi:hypothetical protein